MKKLDKIKEYFIKSNIHILTGAYCNFPDHKGARFTLKFYTDLYNFDAFNREFIICLKNENTSYLKDFLSEKPRYQKIGDFDKGEKLAFELMFYFDNHKYNNSFEFIDSQKQTYQKNYKENIEKYEKFWIEKISEFPEHILEILSRLEHNNQLRRKLKLKSLNGEI
jgi:hypothetical protein